MSNVSIFTLEKVKMGTSPKKRFHLLEIREYTELLIRFFSALSVISSEAGGLKSYFHSS